MSLVSVAFCAIASIANAQELSEISIPEQRVGYLKEPLPIIQAQWGDGVIFPVEFGDAVLSHCSRSSLGRGDAYWTPNRHDIERAEEILRSYTQVVRPKAQSLTEWPDLRSYHRQYIGVVRKGKQTVYASFLPAKGIGEDDWRKHPLELCDGGPSFFGVEISLEKSKVIHIDFDSSLVTTWPGNKSHETTHSKRYTSNR